MMRCGEIWITLAFLVPLASCGHREATRDRAPEVGPRKGVAEVEPIEGSRVTAGQTIYVPAYSSIYISDRAEHFDLAVTLGIRNTERVGPLVVTAAGYYDQ